MDDLPIIQYWHTPELPDHIAKLTGSFVRRNPEREYLLFNRRTAGEFIAECLGEREVRAFAACGPPAMQADCLRYCATLHYGGVWCDADFACLCDLTPLVECSRGGEVFVSPRRPDVRRWRGIVGTVTLAAPAPPVAPRRLHARLGATRP